MEGSARPADRLPLGESSLTGMSFSELPKEGPKATGQCCQVQCIKDSPEAGWGCACWTRTPGPHPQGFWFCRLTKMHFNSTPPNPTFHPLGVLNAGGGWTRLSNRQFEREYTLEVGLHAGMAWSELVNLSLSSPILKRGGDTFTGLL